MKTSPRSLFGLVLLLLLVTGLSSWWSGRAQQRLGAQVAALAAAGDIRMLSSEACGVCLTARAWFKQHQVAFQECLIERDAACRAEFEARQAPGTPVLLVRGQAQLGFSPQRVLASLQPRG